MHKLKKQRQGQCVHQHYTTQELNQQSKATQNN